jgi:hypothetical protein
VLGAAQFTKAHAGREYTKPAASVRTGSERRRGVTGAFNLAVGTTAFRKFRSLGVLRRIDCRSVGKPVFGCIFAKIVYISLCR